MTVTAYRINKMRKILKKKVEDLKEAVIDAEDALGNGVVITPEYQHRKATGYTPMRAEVDAILWTIRTLGLEEEFTPKKCGFDWSGTIL